MSPFPHVRREQVPITDPRWLASTQPDPEPEDDEPVTHWLVNTVSPIRNACGAPSGSRANTSQTLTTCPDCLTTILRTKCLEPDPDDVLGLGIVCKKKLGADGTHEGLHDWQMPLGSPLDDVVRVQVLTDGVTRDSGHFANEAQRSAEARRAAEEQRAAQWCDDGGFGGEPDTPSGVLPVRSERGNEMEVLETWSA